MREQYKKEKARYLRREMSDVENKMWYYLRNRQFFGVKFRRQFPVGPYIADFASMSPPLIIELDGGQHVSQKAYDERRGAFLRQEGFTILRFWNNDVIENIEGVLENIMRYIRSPHPDPLPQAGEGVAGNHA